MKKEKVYTRENFARDIIAKAKDDPLWASLEQDCPLEYVYFREDSSPAPHLDNYFCSVIGYVSYGSNEGLFGTICLETRDGPEKQYLLIFKTLDDNRNCFFAMGQLAALVSYHGTQLLAEMSCHGQEP